MTLAIPPAAVVLRLVEAQVEARANIHRRFHFLHLSALSVENLNSLKKTDPSLTKPVGQALATRGRVLRDLARMKLVENGRPVTIDKQLHADATSFDFAAHQLCLEFSRLFPKLGNLRVLKGLQASPEIDAAINARIDLLHQIATEHAADPVVKAALHAPTDRDGLMRLDREVVKASKDLTQTAKSLGRAVFTPAVIREASGR